MLFHVFEFVEFRFTLAGFPPTVGLCQKEWNWQPSIRHRKTIWILWRFVLEVFFWVSLPSHYHIIDLVAKEEDSIYLTRPICVLCCASNPVHIFSLILTAVRRMSYICMSRKGNHDSLRVSHVSRDSQSLHAVACEARIQWCMSLDFMLLATAATLVTWSTKGTDQKTGYVTEFMDKPKNWHEER